MEKIINTYLKSYAVGPIEKVAAGDSGRGWRDKLTDALLPLRDENNNPIYLFNPVAEENNKTGYEPAPFHKKLKGWIASGKNDLVAEYTDLIWRGKHSLETNARGEVHLVSVMGDCDYVLNSNFIILRMEEHDVPCVAQNSKVLMADWSQKNIQDVKIGDKILGFKKFKGKTLLVQSEVLNAQKTGHRKCIEVSDTKGNKIQVTDNHKFLTKNKKHGSIYTEIKNIDNVFSLRNGHCNKDFLKGWLTGYLQHDGCFIESWRTHQVILVSDKIHEIERVKEILNIFNLSCTITNKINKESHTRIYKLATNTRHDYFELSDWARNHPPSRSFIRGWVAGAIDADGCYSKESIDYSQSKVNNKKIKIFKKYCKQLNIHYSIHFRQRNNLSIFGRKITSSGEYTIRLSKTDAFLIPSQLKYKRDRYTLSIGMLSSKIKKVGIGRRNIYDLTTTTGNFIANGFIVHNCGTFGEAYEAFKHHIPILVLQTMARDKYPVTLVGWVFASGGDFFNSQSELIDHLMKTYNLKKV